MSKSSILQQSPAFDIDVVALNQQFSRHVESLFQRDEVLHDLAASMLEKGYTYNLVFEQILGIRNIENAAIRLFALKGYSDVSIRDIGKEAGVNSAAISYYFGGKRELYSAILQKGSALLVDFVEQAAHGDH